MINSEESRLLTPYRFFKDVGDCPLSEYIAYLDARSIQPLLEIPNSEFLNKHLWPQSRKVITHLEHFGSLTQVEAALLYGCWRLTSVVDKHNKKLRQNKQIEANKTPSEHWITAEEVPFSGGSYSIYTLSDTQPDSKTAKRGIRKNVL